MKTRKQNRNNKRTEIERFDWFIERIQTRVAFGWLSERSGEKLSRNQSILRFDVICNTIGLLHIRVFLGRKTKSPRFDLFILWLIKQITNTYRNRFSTSYENRSVFFVQYIPYKVCIFLVDAVVGQMHTYILDVFTRLVILYSGKPTTRVYSKQNNQRVLIARLKLVFDFS